jgi:phenylpropionate dioxygenase-like ring-hydroxylating dioxygenase large terminal subunit
MVAFRDEHGVLAVMDAHCKHLGAHLGYGGKVKNGCVICPYHGWAWDKGGRNALVPYQDAPTGAKLRTRHVIERHGLIFMWHDPAGGDPRAGWELPDLFADFDLPGCEVDHHPCYPHAVVDKPGEPIHPQLIQENAADCMHFRFTHGAPEDPELLSFETPGTRWMSRMGFKSPKTKQVAMTLHTLNMGPGLSFAAFDGRAPYRLILTATPVDDAVSDLRVSYFLARDPASPEILTEAQRSFAHHTIELFEEDARIWRHQVFVQRPVFARQDIAGYTALRKWSEQFYEAPEGKTPMWAVVEL